MQGSSGWHGMGWGTSVLIMPGPAERRQGGQWPSENDVSSPWQPASPDLSLSLWNAYLTGRFHKPTLRVASTDVSAGLG